LATAARTLASTGLPEARAKAFLAWLRSFSGYDPLPGAFEGTANVLFGRALRCLAVSLDTSARPGVGRHVLQRTC